MNDKMLFTANGLGFGGLTSQYLTQVALARKSEWAQEKMMDMGKRILMLAICFSAQISDGA